MNEYLRLGLLAANSIIGMPWSALDGAVQHVVVPLKLLTGPGNGSRLPKSVENGESNSAGQLDPKFSDQTDNDLCFTTQPFYLTILNLR